jgi:hypothetical protein
MVNHRCRTSLRAIKQRRRCDRRTLHDGVHFNPRRQRLVRPQVCRLRRLNEAAPEAVGLASGRAAMPKATGLSGGASSPAAPRSCATGTPAPSGAVAGVADGKQVGRRGERVLNRILDGERFRDRRLAVSLANVPARKIARSVHEAARDEAVRSQRLGPTLFHVADESRDALRSSEAHPQPRSIAPPRSKRSPRRGPIGRHCPKPEETGETHPPSDARIRHMR